MNKIKHPATIHLNDYSKDIKAATGFYGLTAEIKYFKKCVISNQQPNLAVEFEHTQESTEATLNFGETRLKILSEFAFFEFKNQLYIYDN